MKPAYYNEIDENAAQWIRNLIARGVIAPGEVDTRSIVEVRPDDLRGFSQCHFFAGIGVWSYALRAAGWSDDRPVWTGSCPCQPISVAGARKGHEDERHLWPTWFGLIRESEPVPVFGEQVADGDGQAWLDDVGHDLESIDYALGAVCPAACGFGAPNERQRTYFVADPGGGWAKRHGLALAGAARGSEGEGDQRQRLRADAGDGCNAGGLAHAHGLEDRGLHGRRQDRRAAAERAGRSEAGNLAHPSSGGRRELGDAAQPGRGRHADGGVVADCAVAIAERPGLEGAERGIVARPGDRRPHSHFAGSGAVGGFWADADWIYCRDDRWRPVEPGTFPLVAGAPARVRRLRAYGNAINAEVARHFIAAYLEERP